MPVKVCEALGMAKDIRVETPESRKQEVQQKLVLYQLLQRHLEELRQQALLLERMFIEIETTKQTVSDLKKLKDVDEILVPLGSGFYTHGRVSGTKKFLVDIGASVLVKKNTESMDNVLDDKRKEMENASRELQNEMANTMKKMNELGMELEKMTKEKS